MADIISFPIVARPVPLPQPEPAGVPPGLLFEEARRIIEAMSKACVAKQWPGQLAGLDDPYVAGRLRGYADAVAVLDFLDVTANIE